MLFEEGREDDLQASLANLPGVKLNDLTSSNPGSKRKRVEDKPVRSLSTKAGVVASISGEFNYLGLGPGATQTFLATSDSEDKGNSTISPQMTLLNPQQSPRLGDPQISPAPTLEKYYFQASGRRKLYSEAGKLLYDGSSSFRADRTSLPNFQIDAVSYWFDSYGLLYRDVDGTRRRVLTWSGKQDSFDQHISDQNPISQNDVAILQPNSHPGSFDDFNFISMSILAPDGLFGSPARKTDIPPPSVNPDPLQKALQGLVAQSPSSSTTNSPSSTPTSDPHQPDGPSLFAAAEPYVTQGTKNISPSQHATIYICIEPQEDDEDELPAKKRKRGAPSYAFRKKT
ncbi:hypothetical protein FRC11_015008 [Ceratobasidium sp. 423]|nr:hypothetical protein FRC11_015008 [Ceratobasidium sp. 423]